MSPERAAHINSLLVTAFMVRTGIMEAGVPKLWGITLADCMEASRVMQAAGAATNPDGSKTLTCVVEPSKIPHLYAWVIVAKQDTIVW